MHFLYLHYIMANKMNPKISIIVPVYNAEKYLNRCVDSILSQTFGNFEVLLIDDGSNDKSGKICDKYAQKDCRVKVFHKENGGVSSARNFGIKNVQGSFVTFIDSDDFVDKDFLESLVASDSDFVYTGYKIFGAFNKDVGINENKKYNANDFMLCLMHTYEKSAITLYGMQYPWAKLFKYSIIRENELFFDEKMKYAEDSCFVWSYLCHCFSVSQVKSSTYNYRVENRKSGYKLSAKELKYHIEQYCDVLMTVEHTFGFYSSRYVDFIKCDYFYQFCNYLSCIPYVKFNKEIDFIPMKLKNDILQCLGKRYGDNVAEKYSFLMENKILLFLYLKCKDMKNIIKIQLKSFIYKNA